MALVSPIALALIFGIMQIGYAFMIQHMLQDAARNGCRAAVLPSSSNAAVNSAVNTVLAPMALTGATTTITLNGVSGDVSNARYGDQVSVKVAIPFANVLLFNVSFGGTSGTISGADALRFE
jgi:Flp pilus assembly protein TadG